MHTSWQFAWQLKWMKKKKNEWKKKMNERKNEWMNRSKEWESMKIFIWKKKFFFWNDIFEIEKAQDFFIKTWTRMEFLQCQYFYFIYFFGVFELFKKIFKTHFGLLIPLSFSFLFFSCQSEVRLLTFLSVCVRTFYEQCTYRIFYFSFFFQDLYYFSWLSSFCWYGNQTLLPWSHLSSYLQFGVCQMVFMHLSYVVSI